MRVIEADIIVQAVSELCINSNLYLDKDLLESLKAARDKESSKLGKSALETIVKNAETAAAEALPICQDTGMAVVFAEIGSQVYVNGDISAAINEGVRQGYNKGYLRNSVVKDPIKRINTGDNTPAVIYYDIVQGDKLKLSLAPKGFGSENMGGVKMLNPSDGIEGIEQFVISTVKAAGANPCPPIIVGVGTGGTMDKAALLSKQALLKNVNDSNPDDFWAETERRLLAKINRLYIGPSGYGGDTTALAVHILTYPTHIAGLPVAVNINCHAARHKAVIL